jgi:hypothetical protein
MYQELFDAPIWLSKIQASISRQTEEPSLHRRLFLCLEQQRREFGQVAPPYHPGVRAGGFDGPVLNPL